MLESIPIPEPIPELTPELTAELTPEPILFCDSELYMEPIPELNSESE